MRHWQIDPAGIDRVLHAASSDAADLLDCLSRTRLERVDDDLAQTGQVGAHPRAALQRLLSAQARLLGTAGWDATTGIRSVAAAAATYDRAQGEMAAATLAVARTADSLPPTAGLDRGMAP